MLEEIIAVLNDITGADAGEITPETELFEEGLLDSFGLVELLVQLRALYRALLDEHIFRRAVCITRSGGERVYTVEDLT